MFLLVSATTVKLCTKILTLTVIVMVIEISKLLAPLEIQAQGTSLFTSASSNQRYCARLRRFGSGWQRVIIRNKHYIHLEDTTSQFIRTEMGRYIGRTMVEEPLNVCRPKFNLDPQIRSSSSSSSSSFNWRIYEYIPADTAATGVWYRELAIGMRFLNCQNNQQIIT